MTKANHCPQSENHKPAALLWRVLRLLGCVLVCLIAAQSVPAQCEKVVGVWSWFINGDVTLKPDHTLVQGQLTGNWSCNPANGKVRIDWSHGYSDDLQLVDGQTLSGMKQLRNSVGGKRRSDLPGLQPLPLPRASTSQFVCPLQVGRWPLIPEFRVYGDWSIMRSGELKDGGALPLRTACYYKSGGPQPIGGLSPGFLNSLHFEWVAPGQPASWARCGRSGDARFHYSSARRALVSFNVQDNADAETFRNAGLSVFTNQIEPLAAPCDAPAQPMPAATRDPVIFIPGITGSILKSAKDGHYLWPPEYPSDPTVLLRAVRNDFIRLSLNPKTGPNESLRIDPNTGHREVIYPTDAIRSYLTIDFYTSFLDYLKKSGGYIEYDVNENPKLRTKTGCNDTQKPKPSLFVFAYDWRLAIEDNAELLADYVGCVEKFYPGEKVNIVTHSMGGLVARRYIIDHHPNKVNKLITVAAPFLGAAKPLYQMIYGLLDAELSLMGILKELIFATEVQDMLAYYPGLHELMLSENYYSLGGPLYTFVKNPQLDEPPVQVSYGDLMGPGGIVDKLFPNPSYNGKTPSQTNRDFHSYTSRDGNKQDDWSRDTTGVKYYHLFGVQRSYDTPQSLREAAIRGPLNDEHIRYGLVPNGPGDGTVPQLSAERIVNRQSLNAPNAKPFIYNISDNPLLLEHGGIMTNPAVIAKVLELLREKDADVNLLALPNDSNKSVLQLLAERQANLAIPASERIEGNITVRYQGKIYQTTYERQTDNGVPIDVYFYRTVAPPGVPAPQGEAQWSRFVRVPAADSPNATSVEWGHGTWVQRGGVWQFVVTKGVQFELLGPAATGTPDTKRDRASDTAANSAGPGYSVRYQGRIYQTIHRVDTDAGIPIDIYFYPITQPDGTQAMQNNEKLWGRFVRKPAADFPNLTSVEWWHGTWVQRGGVWEQANTKGVRFEVLGKLP